MPNLLDLLVIVPTRGRPQQAARLVASIGQTKRAHTHMAFARDDDDHSAYHFPPVIGRVHVRRGPRAPISARVNEIAHYYAADYQALAFMNDDMIARTPGWDELLLQQLATPGIAWPESLRRPAFPEAVAISREIVQALGWMMEPSMRHYYCDDVWKTLADQTGCGRFVPAAIIEHLHPDRNPAVPRDQVYADAEAFGRLDRAAYRRWWRERLPADAATICAVLQ